jgi:hypothetical protein
MRAGTSGGTGSNIIARQFTGDSQGTTTHHARKGV